MACFPLRQDFFVWVRPSQLEDNERDAPSRRLEPARHPARSEPAEVLATAESCERDAQGRPPEEPLRAAHAQTHGPGLAHLVVTDFSDRCHGEDLVACGNPSQATRRQEQPSTSQARHSARNSIGHVCDDTNQHGGHHGQMHATFARIDEGPDPRRHHKDTNSKPHDAIVVVLRLATNGLNVCGQRWKHSTQGQVVQKADCEEYG
mmetsp:Transcript_95396/g.221415  ORF Transcript_95396/g.221415 Transcript_95396/m.221415 type:complete len:205 (-) Transcript_95396:284-898(-)